MDDEGVHDEYLPARCCPVAAPVTALVNPLDIGGIKARIGRTGAVTRSHAHEIGISGVITVRFSAERPGVGPGAEVRHSVAKLNDEGDDVHRRGRLPCRWRRLERPRWASGLGFRKGNDSTPWSSVRSHHCSAARCASRSAQSPDPRAARKFPHRLREHVLCGNRGDSAHGAAGSEAVVVEQRAERPRRRGRGSDGRQTESGTAQAAAGRPGGGQAVSDE